MTTKEKLMQCRRAYAERGAKFIEITHLDGQKSAIANPKAIKAAMDALKVELDRQIEELGGDETRSGMNEVVRDWMLREHADERKFMEGFSETVTFAELVKRMEAGENFYDILDCGESQQREYCFRHLTEITDKPYDHWYFLWLSGAERAVAPRTGVAGFMPATFGEAGHRARPPPRPASCAGRFHRPEIGVAIPAGLRHHVRRFEKSPLGKAKGEHHERDREAQGRSPRGHRLLQGGRGFRGRRCPPRGHRLRA